MTRAIEASLAASAGAPSSTFVIAEVAQTHDGSLGLAHAFIDAVARTGADAVKFQTHIASAESTRAEPWRVPFSKQDATRFDYWKRLEFSEEQWAGLERHARDAGLVFLSSAFSPEAVHLLTRIGITGWKVASGEVSNSSLLESMLATKLPMILSSGMSSYTELDRAVNRVRTAGVPFGVLQCTTAYPCPPEEVGLNVLAELRERYRCAVGLSDHSGTIYPSLAATTLGASVLEVHVALTREMFGPDVIASVTTTELRQLVDGVRFIERMQHHPADKDAAAEAMLPLRRVFTRSLVARMNLPAGTVLRNEHLASKKPGTGMSPDQLPSIVGRRLCRDLAADELLSESDLERES